MDNLPFSAGWVYLIGSLIGIVTVSLAKTFSWKNYEFLASEDDRKEAVAMTPLRRLILIGICVLIGAYGAIEVQRDHGWSAFAPRDHRIPRRIHNLSDLDTPSGKDLTSDTSGP